MWRRCWNFKSSMKIVHSDLDATRIPISSSQNVGLYWLSMLNTMSVKTYMYIYMYIYIYVIYNYELCLSAIYVWEFLVFCSMMGRIIEVHQIVTRLHGDPSKYRKHCTFHSKPLLGDVFVWCNNAHMCTDTSHIRWAMTEQKSRRGNSVL